MESVHGEVIVFDNPWPAETNPPERGRGGRGGEEGGREDAGP